ncbi:MAG: hypothetical protein COX46_03290 [bacterium (Candidatus Ratteibacteria) CG23_combo_of_CG06-09_8_20_14_all_48_7]|uniref:Glycosyl transferase family 1 domain-containing protein n=1 Tax=bacterium (Candidatus Ratteibacteria) CG23_combo_of_CG06-09_8_20_14_all_48_7 TaxID=2014292 RepID=A0A2G9YAM9_9BACT|nr:MAG: hypothetical protein COX46_03290 [bacterium (Candidatus Ratteibacteria) CG23_combo_of_CG06-09_8_20_14_all_48_7]
MRISIIATAGKKVSGQTRVLLEYAYSLVTRGHQVAVVKPFLRHFGEDGRLTRRLNLSFRKGFYFITGPKIRNYSVAWFEANFPFLTIPYVSDFYLSDADFLIFSSPGFIGPISGLSEKKGKPVFLVQSSQYVRNPVPDPPEAFLLAAISSSNERILKTKLPHREIALLVNGVNLNKFSNPAKVFRPAVTVGMIFYQKRPVHKGIEDGIRAFDLVHRKFPYLKLRMAGERREKWLPSYIEFWDGINQENLVRFYRSLDIFLYPSRLDACPLTPMEALACKCGLVTTDVAGISDFTIPGKTALSSPVGDVAALARNLASLVENSEKLKELSIAGYEKIKGFSYENQTKKLEEILKNSF